ncbi:hypothetical protein [Planococcus sp. ISL-109]|uniref:hypothetical protein n=1 Tax=Planococcus sp. ISL-109 TaxID=2819166 RepID=UPI001BE8EBFB|nr:hypothetical protein [Planococcus sp. ISL-109]
MPVCNRHNIAISTGTACKISSEEAISTTGAIGIESDGASKFIRISFTENATENVVEASLKEFSMKK